MKLIFFMFACVIFAQESDRININTILGSWHVKKIDGKNLELLTFKPVDEKSIGIGSTFNFKSDKTVSILSNSGCVYGFSSRSGKWTYDINLNRLKVEFENTKNEEFEIITLINSKMLLKRLE